MTSAATMDHTDSSSYPPRPAAPPAAGRGLAQPAGQQPAVVAEQLPDALAAGGRRRERSPDAENARLRAQLELLQEELLVARAELALPPRVHLPEELHTRFLGGYPILALDLHSAFPLDRLRAQGSHTRQVRLGRLEFEQTATADPEWLKRIVDGQVVPAYALDALIVEHFTNMHRPTAGLGQTPWTEKGLSMGYLLTFLQSLATPGNTRLRLDDSFSRMGMRTMENVVTVVWNLHKIRGVLPPQGDDVRHLLTSLRIGN